jgi:hypothetical protein
MAGGGDLGFYIGSYATDAAATAFLTGRGYTQARGYEYWDSALSQLKKWDGAAWGQITGAGATSPWTEAAGVIAPGTPATDDVVVGAAAMASGERFRVVGGARVEKSDSQADDALYVQVSGSHPTTENAMTIDVDVADLAVAALLIDSEVDGTSTNGSPLIQLDALSANPRGDIGFTSVRTADPTSPVKGDFWWHDTAAAFKYYDGISVQTISVGGTSPWSEAGAPSVLYPTTPTTDDVVIGGPTAMVGTERLRAYNTQSTSFDVAMVDWFVAGGDTPTSVRGLVVQGTATGDPTTSVSIDLDNHNGAGAITNSYGMRIQDLGLSSTNVYCIYIDDQTASNSYAIWQNGTGDRSVFQGDVAIGTSSMFGAERLRVLNTDTSGSPSGIWVSLDHDSGSIGTWTGVFSEVDTNALEAEDITASYGVYSRVNMAGASDIGTHISFYHVVNTGTASNVITDCYGLRAASPLGSGTITNAYGVYIDAQSGGTLSYGLYQAGTTDLNVLRGDTVVGTTAMAGTEVLRSYSAGTSVGLRSALIETDLTGGSVASLYNLVTFVNVDGTISAAGFVRNVEISSVEGGGSVDNSAFVYQLFIAKALDGPSGSPTTYGLYQDSADDVNYFAGHVGINRDPPTVDDYLEIEDDEDTGLRNAIHVNLDKTGSGSKTTYRGVYSTGDVTAGTGVSSGVEHFHGARFDLDSGTIANAYGLHLYQPDVAATVTLTTAHGVRVESPVNAGTIGSIYGLRVDQQGVGTYTNAWGIYQQGSDDGNYFAGDVGIGTTTLTAGVLTVTDNNASTTQSCIEAQLNKTASGTITTWRGVEVDPYVNAGTVSTMNCFIVDPPSGSGTITTIRGLAIPALLAGPAAGGTAYAIWQSGASDLNELNGETGIGSGPDTGVSQLYVQRDEVGSVGATRAGIHVKLNYNIATGPVTITDFRAIDIDIANNNTDTTSDITAATGVYVNSPTGAGGDINFAAAFYCEDMEADSDVLDGWGVYLQGSSTRNYFGGVIGAKSATPNSSYAIDANGDINIQSGNVFRYAGSAGLSGTYSFGGGGTGDIATMTFAGGILTGVTTVP